MSWPHHGGAATTNSYGEVVPTSLGEGYAEIQPKRVAGSPHFAVSAFQHMGDRKTQEDRFVVAPSIGAESRCTAGFFGVFDGTVGDFASRNVKELVLPKLLAAESWQSIVAGGAEGERVKHLESANREMYRAVDEEVITRCAQNSQHYATCTSVTLLVFGELLVVGHLGDSRVVLGKMDTSSRKLVAEQLTQDHKPDHEEERARIEQSGGSVVWLQNHGNKPFIRGGDFIERKTQGEQPMQVQYSRAFGAKDLKCYGVSSIPDLRTIRMGTEPYKHVKFLILASDGLWDILPAQRAVEVAQQAVNENDNPAEMLVQTVLLEKLRRKAKADNITAICIHFD